MSEPESSVESPFKDGDVVWVKLAVGSCWWPGEVQNSEPIHSFKKPPIAVVKFFEEDSFEYPRVLANIYPFQCDRKDEFIKKGLTASKARLPNPEKFKADVILAEVRTGGNPNILGEPQFMPEKKINYVEEAFGSPKKKKLKLTGRRRGRQSLNPDKSPRKDNRNIVHPRFLGANDFSMQICIQFPGKFVIHEEDRDAIIAMNTKKEEQFYCISCPYETENLEVMEFHQQYHLNEIVPPLLEHMKKRKSRSPTKKRRKSIELESEEVEDEEEDEKDEVPVVKQSRKSQGKKQGKKTKKTAGGAAKKNIAHATADSAVIEGGLNGNSSVPTEKKIDDGAISKDITNCFDFDEDNEEETLSTPILPVSSVLRKKSPVKAPDTPKKPEEPPKKPEEPPKKPEEPPKKSEEPSKKTEEPPKPVEDTPSKPIPAEEPKNDPPPKAKSPAKSPAKKSDEEEAFEEIMKATAIPTNITETTSLGEEPKNKLKCEQNFPSAKTVKFPDKSEATPPAPPTSSSSSSPIQTTSEVATKLTNPKKRFAKSFEDFEQYMNEQRKLEGTTSEKPRDNSSAKKLLVGKIMEAVKESTDSTDILGVVFDKDPPPEKSNRATSPSVEIAKLKNTIMMKISEEVAATPRKTRSSTNERPLPQTPRSKILEKYRKRKSSSSSEPEVEVKKPIITPSKKDLGEKLPPKKSAWTHKKGRFYANKVEPQTALQPQSLKNEEEPAGDKPYPKKTFFPFRQQQKRLMSGQNKDGDAKKDEEEKKEEEEDEEEEISVEITFEPDQSSLNEIESPQFDQLSPKRSPIKTPPLASPVKSPSPIKSQPVSSPIRSPVASPIKSPVAKSPIKSPLSSPKGTIKSPLASPIKSPRASPVKSPVSSPIRSPVASKSLIAKSPLASPKVVEEEAPPTKLEEPIEEKPVEEEVKKASPVKVKKPIDEEVTPIKEPLPEEKVEQETKEPIVEEAKPLVAENVEEAKPLVTEKVEEAEPLPEKTVEAPPPKINEPIIPVVVSKAAKKILDDWDDSTEDDDEAKLAEADDIIINKIPPPPIEQSELVEIEGNLTIVSEKDLADGQVEIAAITTETVDILSPKKPATKSLIEFSLDYSESSNEAATVVVPPAVVAPPPKPKTVRPTKKTAANERLELLNILEGTSNEPKVTVSTSSTKNTTLDFDDMIPSQIISTQPPKMPTQQILKTTLQGDFKLRPKLQQVPVKSVPKPVTPIQKATPPAVKPAPKTSGTKPIILSEKIFKGQNIKGNLKRTFKNFDEVESVFYPKKKEEATPSKIGTGKAKILQQTIITPSGQIIPSISGGASSTSSVTDDNMFDINSMPIVLSDELLTPESIENMPIVLESEVKKAAPAQQAAPSPLAGTKKVINKILQSQIKKPKVVPSVGGANKIVKASSVLPTTPTAKPGKYIIVSSHNSMGVTTPPISTTPSTNKKIIGKKSLVVKKPDSPVANKVVSTLSGEPSTGNKIMIFTNNQGQQERLLLTPSQQKQLGFQQGSSTPTNTGLKTVMKSNLLQKNLLAKQNLVQKMATPTKSLVVQRATPTATKKPTPTNQKVYMNPGKQQKTILIKNQLGQTVRKLQGNDDALLDRQVAEQIEAIKASSSSAKVGVHSNKVATPSQPIKTPVRKVAAKKPGVAPPTKAESSGVLPPLAPLSPEKVEPKAESKRPVKQLIIQDALGHQTTITEGQILALPSETVDGQPQSYMLVTLDESGNLTPLSNDALSQLGPNVFSGGDPNNMMLQIDQSGELSSGGSAPVSQAEVASPAPVIQEEVVAPPTPVVPEDVVPEAPPSGGQQLVVTGDTTVAQKFLDSIHDGNTDLSNILASVVAGRNVVIHLEGNQIIVDLHADSSVLGAGQAIVTVAGNPTPATPIQEESPASSSGTNNNKFPDILAAALADTDFQQAAVAPETQPANQSAPSSGLVQNQATPFPMQVGSVLETSLTLSSPIMTPLEVPSSNNKKIPDEETDILTQVPKNVDLPITITDPNISQTVSQTQVAVAAAAALMTTSELQDLGALPTESVASSVVEMDTPFGYALPTLGETRTFNSSMPLLTEDVVDEVMEPAPAEAEVQPPEETIIESQVEPEPIVVEAPPTTLEAPPPEVLNTSFSAGEDEEGLCTLGASMCNSLSEPPPEMFEICSGDLLGGASSKEEVVDNGVGVASDENSCEIPLQPAIVARELAASPPPQDGAGGSVQSAATL